MSDAAARDKAELFGRAVDQLNALGAGDDVFALFVPGRLEFLGKHTDYAGGRSLICAIERGFCLAAAPRADRTVRIVLADTGDKTSFDLDPDLTPTPGHWTNYPMTVARRVARNFPGGLCGADIALASDLPPASGMSSSSALIIALFLVLDHVNALRDRDEYRTNIKTTEDLAGYLATIENGQSFSSLAGDRGVGTFGGSEDHTAILGARPGQLSMYRFCPVVHEQDIALPESYELAIASSGVIAEKTGAARERYNRASNLVHQIMTVWNEKTGRSDPHPAAVLRAVPDGEQQMRDVLRQAQDSDALLARFDQFAAESEHIIPQVARFLAQGDIDAVGPLIDRSQSLTQTLLGNQVEQTVELAASARRLGASAASAFGAGFGGSVWALVRSSRARGFIESWKHHYHERFTAEAQRSRFFLTRAGPSATLVARPL
jgi:galactokinase